MLPHSPSLSCKYLRRTTHNLAWEIHTNESHCHKLVCDSMVAFFVQMPHLFADLESCVTGNVSKSAASSKAQCERPPPSPPSHIADGVLVLWDLAYGRHRDTNTVIQQGISQIRISKHQISRQLFRQSLWLLSLSEYDLPTSMTFDV